MDGQAAALPSRDAENPRPSPRNTRHVTRADLFLKTHPGVKFAAWHSGGRAHVDLLVIPVAMRRRGLATMLCRLWQADMDDGTVIEVMPLDADAATFWASLGYVRTHGGRMTLVIGDQEHRVAA